MKSIIKLHFFTQLGRGKLQRYGLPSFTFRNFTSRTIFQEGGYSFNTKRNLLYLFGGLSVGALIFENAKADEEKITEKTTGAEFPAKLKLEQGNFELISVAPRTITFLKFNTYAVGYYITPQLRSKLQELPKKSIPEFIVENKEGTQVLRVIPSRNVQAGHLLKGFADAMTPFLKEKLGDSAKDMADQFLKLVPFGRNFEKNSNLDMIINSKGTLAIQLDGKSIASIESPEICNAFLTVYFGKKTKLKLRKEVKKALKKK